MRIPGFPAFALALACSLLAGCGDSEEPAPLADGQYLRYEWGIGADAVAVEVKVRKDGDEHFRLEIRAEGEDEEKPPTTIRVDRFFKTDEGKLARLIDHPLWLPPAQRESGTPVVDDGSIAIGKKTKTWNGWNVLVASGGAVLGTVEWYFDKDTGFLVGTYTESMGSAMMLRLTETNVPGLAR